MNFDTITDWNQTNEAIAKQFGCCDRTVRNARRARGLPRAPDKVKRTILKDQFPQISLRAWRTHSNREIAYILKCSIAAVYLFRTTHNKPTRDLQLKVASKTNDLHPMPTLCQSARLQRPWRLLHQTTIKYPSNDT